MLNGLFDLILKDFSEKILQSSSKRPRTEKFIKDDPIVLRLHVQKRTEKFW